MSTYNRSQFCLAHLTAILLKDLHYQPEALSQITVLRLTLIAVRELRQVLVCEMGQLLEETADEAVQCELAAGLAGLLIDEKRDYVSAYAILTTLKSRLETGDTAESRQHLCPPLVSTCEDLERPVRWRQ